jgi:hypothetical protein
MKTIIGSIACVVSVAALMACHHDETPTRTPAQETTTTSSYQPYQPATQPQPQTQAQSQPPQSTYMQPAPQETPSSAYDQDRAAQNADIQPAPATPTDSSLMNDQAGATSPKTEPGPVNAKKQPDKKSPNAAAVTDQGNSKAEVQISGRVRKALMASKTLSFGAKNVKVITKGTKITLRGTVKTDAEKNEIVGIARNTDGVSEVDDQLVVKP